MSSFSAFLRSLSSGSPVVCFGSRSCPPWVLSAAGRVGRLVASAGCVAVYGGSRGVDSAFVSAAQSAGGSCRVFAPAPGSGVPGLFARSRSALQFALSRSGCAVIFVPSGALAGGSLWSFRCAVSLGLPVWLVSFSGSSFSVRFVPQAVQSTLF